MRALILASITAVCIQPFVFVFQTAFLLVISLAGGATMASGELHNLLQELLPVTVYVVVVSTVFVLVLGLPIFLVLKHLNKLSWRWLIAFGFSAAAIPLALVTFPLWPSPANVSSGANWHGHYVDFVKNGIYTIYGWLNYVENVLWFGVHGVVGSAVFYYVWLKIVRPNPALKRTANAAA